MKIKSFLLLSLAAFFSYYAVQAQTSYRGTLVTKMGSRETCTITVNLNGSNNELIGFVTEEKKKVKKASTKTKQTITSAAKLNVALISYIIINDTTYYFRDIKYDYNEKYHMNVCVRLVAGTLNCGIFQQGRSSGKDELSVKLPNNDFSKLVSVDFDYYKATLGWHIMAFGQCASLSSKMSAKQEGYYWDDSSSRGDRITMWEKWVEEFNACNEN